MMVSACCTTSAGESYVVLAGVCGLSEPLAIPPGAHSRSNGLFRLESELEIRARTTPAVQGCCLNMQFSALASEPWRCWLLQPRELDTLLGTPDHPPQALKVEGKVFRAMGVDPTLVGTMREMLPFFDLDAAPASEVAGPSAPPYSSPTAVSLATASN